MRACGAQWMMHGVRGRGEHMRSVPFRLSASNLRVGEVSDVEVTSVRGAKRRAKSAGSQGAHEERAF